MAGDPLPPAVPPLPAATSPVSLGALPPAPVPPAPLGGAFGLPGGTLGMPGGIPGGVAGAAAIGAPGGVFGPPGGAAPQALAPLTLPAPLPGAMQAGVLTAPLGGLPSAISSALAAPPPGRVAPLGGAPGGALPGAGLPVAMPDLSGLARDAMARVMEDAGPGPEAPPVSLVPSVSAPQVDPFPPAAPALAPWALPVPPPPPPPPPRARLAANTWPGAEPIPAERDTVQRVGDALYPLVVRVRESRLGWFGVIALFGLTGPIVLMRQRFDSSLRLILALIVFAVWFQSLRELF